MSLRSGEASNKQPASMHRHRSKCPCRADRPPWAWNVGLHQPASGAYAPRWRTFKKKNTHDSISDTRLIYGARSKLFTEDQSGRKPERGCSVARKRTERNCCHCRLVDLFRPLWQIWEQEQDNKLTVFKRQNQRKHSPDLTHELPVVRLVPARVVLTSQKH